MFRITKSTSGWYCVARAYCNVTLVFDEGQTFSTQFARTNWYLTPNGNIVNTMSRDTYFDTLKDLKRVAKENNIPTMRVK